MTEKFILTNHPGQQRSPTWNKYAHFQPSKQYSKISQLNHVINSYNLFRNRLHYQVVVLGGNSKENLVYLILQRMFPWTRKPIIQIECLWFKSKPIKQFFKKILWKWLDKVNDVYFVYSKYQIEEYSKNFRIDKNKIFFLPYHTTIDEPATEIKKGDYLFTGGNTARDYKTLIEAVRGLDIKVKIARSDIKLTQDIDIPENVYIQSVSHDEFRRLMQKSWINVVPLCMGSWHKAGQQTFLNAMALGKPVIVTDPEGAKDYIEDGHDGFLVPPNQPEKLKEVIQYLMTNEDFAKNIANNAKKKTELLTTENHLKNIVNKAKQLVR